jgi:hypothetical protein
MASNKNIGLIVGLTVFAVNMTENVVHYSLGKSNGGKFKFYKPTLKESGHMIATSILAGVLVGVLTKQLTKQLTKN